MVEAIGQDSLCINHRGDSSAKSISATAERTITGECPVRSPGNKVTSPLVLRIEVQKVIVLVRAVSVPIPRQILQSPVPKERIKIDELSDFIQVQITLCGKQLSKSFDVTQIVRFFVRFDFQIWNCLRMKVRQCPFIEVAGFVCKVLRKELLPDAFDVGVNTKTLSVDDDMSPIASRRRIACLSKQPIRQVLAHLRAILQVVVQGELAEPLDRILLLKLVKLDLQ